MNETLPFDEIWKTDLLHRRDDAEFLIRFLLERIKERGEHQLPRSYVLNLDAAWGHGKTYFIERLGEHLSAMGFLVASVNAWRDDHAEDPLLAVISAIDDTVTPIIKTKRTIKKTWQSVKRTGSAIAVAAAKGGLKQLARKVVGEAIDEIVDELSPDRASEVRASAEAAMDKTAELADKRADELLAGFREGKRSIDTFRRQLAGFLGLVAADGKNLPLFVLVDELDRCRPPYAIALLERIKHLFDIDDVIFVITTDTSQLQHAIGAVYGAGFDSQKYLLRFFDRTYFFEEPSIEDFVAALCEQYGLASAKLALPPNQDLNKFIAAACSYYGLSLRDVEQCIDILRSVITTWQANVPLELVVLLPMIIGHQQGIVPALTKSFATQLDELRGRNSGKGSWKFLFRDRRQGPAEQSVTGIELFNVFAALRTSTLPDILQREGGGAAENWVKSRYSDEFHMLYRGTYQPNDPPRSIIKEYPAVIRSAGRLSARVSPR